MNRLGNRLRPGADAVLRRPAVERFALRLAGRRGRGLAVLWHRVGPHGPQAHEVVPTVPIDAFARQLDVLRELGDVVSLAQLESPTRSRRPRFALTFDDDDPGHARHTLPLLADRGLSATFFLSGRWLHGYGPYWWKVLEDSIRETGLGTIAERHGVPGCADAGALARTLTGTNVARELAEQGRTAPPTMTAEDAAALVAAGMEIGFHTVDHPAVPLLNDDALRRAVTNGRDKLSQHLGVPIHRFAYPHGRVDERAARAVADCGYVSAWTTRKRVTAKGEDPVLRGRWDLGYLAPDRLRAVVVRALARPYA